MQVDLCVEWGEGKIVIEGTGRFLCMQKVGGAAGNVAMEGTGMCAGK